MTLLKETQSKLGLKELITRTEKIVAYNSMYKGFFFRIWMGLPMEQLPVIPPPCLVWKCWNYQRVTTHHLHLRSSLTSANTNTAQHTILQKVKQHSKYIQLIWRWHDILDRSWLKEESERNLSPLQWCQHNNPNKEETIDSLFVWMLPRNQLHVWKVQKSSQHLCWSQHLPAGNSSLHLHQHIQHGHRVPWSTWDSDQGGGGQQPRVQLHLHCGDDSQTHSLWICSVCQWWFQCLWWLHCLFGVRS